MSIITNNAGMVELADTLDLGSSEETHAGSSPVTRTSNKAETKREIILAHKMKILNEEQLENVSGGGNCASPDYLPATHGAHIYAEDLAEHL